MVRELILLPDFNPGVVKAGGEIPKFQYRKSLQEELREESLGREECIDLLKCMLFIRNFEEMIWELRERKGRYGSMKYLYITAGTEMP